MFTAQNQGYHFTPWSRSWPLTAPPPCSLHSDKSEARENDPKWFLLPKNMGIDTKNKALNFFYHVQNQSYNFTPWSYLWPPTAPPPCSWLLGGSEVLDNSPKWFPMTKGGSSCYGLGAKGAGHRSERETSGGSPGWARGPNIGILGQNRGGLVW